MSSSKSGINFLFIIGLLTGIVGPANRTVASFREAVGFF